ncbi:MAG TPA: DNA mismatch repair endonuclease MutL, partial [Aggregatilineales bacterium]|nr:DNA mismatch repair endonuclease MutL [Aggregatilineales bacterium]
MPIHILSEVVAAQIAAGEVVERPASVVKELIENSLDAGARRVEIDVSDSSLRLIRISDDGHGIPAQEIELALMRHATSKLQTVDDLSRIRTLGFRGEALGSIASVARVTLTSHADDEETGAQIIVEGGQVIDKRAIGAPPGTTVEVANLFYNVPARRKFLKSESTERKHITNLISRYAMAYPGVRFAMTIEEREAFRTSGSGDLADVIIDTMGIEVFRDMVEVSPVESRRADLQLIEVSGFTTTPAQTRSNRSQIILFANGRTIQDQRLSYAVVQAYHTLIPQGRYPISILMIDMPPEEVDVNVHPTKAEVRFRSPDAVFSAVQHSVRAAVLNLSDTRQVTPPDFTGFNRSWDAPPDLLSESFRPTGARVVNPQQLGIDLDTPDAGRRSNQMSSYRDDDEDDDAFVQHIPSGNANPQYPRNLPPMRIVGQIAATYIVAEGPAGMYLIDQHAAHERIMYELFMRRHETQAAEKLVQHALESTVVELTAVNMRSVEEYLP